MDQAPLRHCPSNLFSLLLLLIFLPPPDLPFTTPQPPSLPTSHISRHGPPDLLGTLVGGLLFVFKNSLTISYMYTMYLGCLAPITLPYHGLILLHPHRTRLLSSKSLPTLVSFPPSVIGVCERGSGLFSGTQAPCQRLHHGRGCCHLFS